MFVALRKFIADFFFFTKLKAVPENYILIIMIASKDLYNWNYFNKDKPSLLLKNLIVISSNVLVLYIFMSLQKYNKNKVILIIIIYLRYFFFLTSSRTNSRITPAVVLIREI